jgi:ribosomal protein S18 acetylase RimI-like enzyme
MGGGKLIHGDRTEKLISGLRDLPTSLVFLAVVNNKFIGLCNCFVSFATFTVKKIINIHDIVVLNEYRGYGVGKKLMEEVISYARKLDCSKVTLEVREDNIAAQNLYKDMGFTECEPKMYFWVKKI